MKRFFKSLSALMLALLLVSSLTVPAFADSSVDYKGGAEKFIFASDGTQLTGSDLFGSFKDIYPGDSIEQRITVKNSLFGPKSVRIYMRAIAHDESNPLSPAVAETEDLVSMSDFLSRLRMTVENKGNIIFDASPAELGGLRENVLLGEFPKGSSTELVVTLYVPIELGNEYANRIGEVDWVFTAEEIPEAVKPIDPSRPKTGDESNIALWISLAAVSLAVIIIAVILVFRKKKH